MVVLPNQRKNNCSQISFARQTRNDLLVKRFVGRGEGNHRDFKPRPLVALSRMIESRQVRTLRRHARPRLRDHTHYAQTLNPAQMLAGHAPQRALDVLQSITRQLAFVLILDLNSHCGSVSQPDDYAQQRLSTLREMSVL